MFVLPALLFPLVFGLAMVRLYQIPRKLWSGELQLPGKQRAFLRAATVIAYVVLFGYTTALGAALVHALVAAENKLSAYWVLVVYVAAYPVVYIGAAWVFYYGFRSRPVMREPLPHTPPPPNP